jgi:hypothetical protein|tara:strand:+ start:795 stop:2390 length:1596 start_codon:yes stop_codon:yes gene_type:complete
MSNIFSTDYLNLAKSLFLASKEVSEKKGVEKELAIDDSAETFTIQLNSLLKNKEFNKSIQDIQVANIDDEGKDGFGDVDIGDWYGFQSIPRTQGIMGLFVSPTSKVSFTQMQNMSLDAVAGTQIQFITSYLSSCLLNYSHNDKKFEALVKRSMLSCDWASRFLFGLAKMVKFGNACGQMIWDYDELNKEMYIKDVVWVPNTNLQYMVDMSGKMMGAIQPNVFANPEGLFPAKFDDNPESEFSSRQYIAEQLPFMLMPKDDLFYVAYDNLHDPYGVSLLRRGYQHFQNKQLLLNMLLNASAKNSAPYIIATYDVAAQREIEVAEIEEKLSTLSVGDTAVIPKGIEVEAIDVNKGSISSLLEAIKYSDAMMIRSLIGGSTGEVNISSDSGGGYAGKSEDNDNVEKTLKFWLKIFEDSIKKQFIHRLAETNGYNNVMKNMDYGTFIPSEGTISQKLQIAKLYELGINSYMINPENEEIVNSYLSKLGLNPATSKDLEANKKRLTDNEMSTPNGKGTSSRDTGAKYSHQSTGKPN